MNNHLVFVYGSLKKGFGNHRLLAESQMVDNHVTEPKFSMYSLGAFPCVVPRGDTAIHGELYAVDDETLRRLDALEGVPNFYQRHTINTMYGDAIMYVINKGREAEDRKIYSGVWEKPKWG